MTVIIGTDQTETMGKENKMATKLKRKKYKAINSVNVPAAGKQESENWREIVATIIAAKAFGHEK